MAGASDYYFSSLLNEIEEEELPDFLSLDNAIHLNVNSIIVESIIIFCYSGGIDISVHNVENVLTGAKELQVKSLVLICSEWLKKTLHVSNCIHYLKISEKQDIESLRENALVLIFGVLPHFNRLPEFSKLSASQMFWLMDLLSRSRNGIFDNLLQMMNYCDSLPSIKPECLDGSNINTQSAVRAAVSIHELFYYSPDSLLTV